MQLWGLPALRAVYQHALHYISSLSSLDHIISRERLIVHLRNSQVP